MTIRTGTPTIRTPSITLRGRGLGDVGADCAAQAQANTAGLTQQIDDLQRTWQPTGLYQPSEILDGVGRVLAMMTEGTARVHDMLDSSRWNVDYSQLGVMSAAVDSQSDNLNQSLDDMGQQLKRAQSYMIDAGKASTQGALLAAPEFKLWVLHALDLSVSAIDAAQTVMCVAQNMPSFTDQLIALAQDVINFARKTVGAVIKAGQTIVKAAESTFDVLVFAVKWGPWIALGLLAALVTYKVGKTRGWFSSLGVHSHSHDEEYEE